MNSAIIGLVTIVWLVLAYKIYGRFIEKRLVQPDPERKLPSEIHFDNVDFRPTRPIILFGHHFSSIAGAGPIIGPVLAVAYFGWGIGFLWILLGVVFIGAVHDYLALIISIRHDGRSVPDIAGDIVGRRARVLFQTFVWVTLVLVIAAFVDAAASSFIKKPEIVVASLGLIPLAMLFGWAVHRRGVPVLVGTLVALALLGVLIWLGYKFPVALHEVSSARFPGAWAVVSLGLSETATSHVWYLVLCVYGLVASVLPVWFLLQPRDYIANWILLIGMGLGFAGLFASQLEMNAEFFTQSVTAKGPVWPMLFVIIACGAISGFHSLVSSGTTAKQLDNERNAKIIGYGGMLTEGALAVLALLAVGAGLGWGELQDIVVGAKGGPITAFGRGFGQFAQPVLSVFTTPEMALSLGVFFGITMINAFVMTTLDTSVRLCRFITQESLGQRVKLLGGRTVASALAVIPAYLVLVTGSKASLWPMFASANQLVAGLTLVVISAYLVGVRKPSLYTAIPAVLMLTTTMASLVYQLWSFLAPLWTPETADEPNYLLAALALVLFGLAIVVVVDAARAMRSVSMSQSATASPAPKI